MQRILARTCVQHVEYHPTLASTSDTARELLADLLRVAPSVVLTDQQTAGRGRQGKSWEATGGSLTFSVVIDPTDVLLAPDQRSLIAIATGAAVHDVLSQRLPGHCVQIKWPNDVLVDSRKVCGILIEQHGHPEGTGVVIGVGVNVNNSFQLEDGELRHAATSLFDLLHVLQDQEELLVDLLNSIMDRLKSVSTRLPLMMAEVNAVHVLNTCHVTVGLANQRTSGLCIGIDDEGCLVLKDQSGQVQRMRSGTVLEWHAANSQS